MRPSNPVTCTTREIGISQRKPRSAFPPNSLAEARFDLTTALTVITKPADLMGWLIDYLDTQEPRVNLGTGNGFDLVHFCDTHCDNKLTDLMIIPHYDPDASFKRREFRLAGPLRNGLPLVHFVQRCANAMIRVPSPDPDERDDDFTLLPMGLTFAIALHGEPGLRDLLRISRTAAGNTLIETTEAGHRWIGSEVRVEADGWIEPDEVAALVADIPYVEDDGDDDSDDDGFGDDDAGGP